MNDEFRATVSRLALCLYQFSYLLIPDRLQAQQVAIDSLAKLGLSWGPMRLALEERKFNQDYKKFQARAYQSAFSIAQARVGHFGSLIETGVETKGPWNELNFEERAVVYLFYQQRWPKREIAEIIGRSIYDVMAILAGARDVFDNQETSRAKDVSHA